MLRNPDFDSKDLDPDLHKRLNRADDGHIKSFNMREGSADGDQDLNLWLRELEDMVCEIMEDPIFKGNQNFKFEMDGRTVYIHSTYIVHTLYIHCTYIVRTNMYGCSAAKQLEMQECQWHSRLGN